MTKGVWKEGKLGGCIVTNLKNDRSGYTEDDFYGEHQYYGGYLIAESILNQDLNVLVNSKKMFILIKNMIILNFTYKFLPYFLFIELISLLLKIDNNCLDAYINKIEVNIIKKHTHIKCLK